MRFAALILGLLFAQLAGAATLLGDTRSPSVLTFVDTTPGFLRWCYTVTAYDTAGMESAPTNPVCAIPITGPPYTITLNWTPPTTNADGSPLTDLAGFRIYRTAGSSAAHPTGLGVK